jgi:hypothetical protein
MKGSGRELPGKGFVITELRWEPRLPSYTELGLKKLPLCLQSIYRSLTGGARLIGAISRSLPLITRR